jgi:hypothetical protein
MDKKRLLYSTVIIIGIVVIIIFARAKPVTIDNKASPISISVQIEEDFSQVTPVDDKPPEYIEIIDSCNFAYAGECVNLRGGPGTEYPSIFKVRTGMVLAVASTTTLKNGRIWYKIIFAHPLLYPERVTSPLYVAGDIVRPFRQETSKDLIPGQKASTTKRIVVDVSEQKLYAYDGDDLFIEESISTGLEFTPTPKGEFTVFRMTPSRFMQGPIPGVSDQAYDLPGVPWNLYFTREGAVIHGAYWHDSFGKKWSHGCVNVSPESAKKLYEWAELGMTVTVKK